MTIHNKQNQKNFAQPSETFGVYDMGIPVMQTDTSTSLKKAIIEYENRIRDEWLEHGVIFAPTGKIIAETIGTQDTISFDLTSEQEILAYNAVMTHNHPKGFTFSYEDIKTACELKLAEVRAVTKYCRHSMQFNGHWRNRFALQKAFDNAEYEADAITERLILADLVSASHAAYELEHQKWGLVAKQFGFTYTRSTLR